MKKIYRRNVFKPAFAGLMFLLTVSAFMLKFTVSAGSAFNEPPQKHSDATFDLRNERARQIVESPVFKNFDEWLGQFQNGLFRDSDEQLRRGENLANARAELVRELIGIAPETALKYSVSEAAKKDLPASIAGKIERRVSAYGDLLVFAVDVANDSNGNLSGGTERDVVFGETKYKAFVYGRRSGMTTKINIPLQGIILNDAMAVDENPARVIETNAYSLNNIDAEKAGENGAVAEIGGALRYFSSRLELDEFVSDQIEWESKIAPVRQSENQATNSAWTEGPKTVLIIRVDFSDRVGEPVDVNGAALTPARAAGIIASDVNPFFVLNSYNKTSIQAPTVTPVLRLPQTQAYYGQGGGLGNYTALLNDARTVARAAGYETNNFSFDIVAFTNIAGLSYAGLGNIGAKGLWMNGYFNRGVFNHELGHNFGLNHSNLWRTTDGTVIGAGASQEYGDAFDSMGSAPGDGVGHFNARYKRILDWLTDDNIRTVTSSGIYRIYAQDNATVGGIRGLKINKNSTKNYWIEFRQQFTTNSAAMNGAVVRWDFASDNYRTTQLLDMTPATSTNANDAPLVIGQSFTDTENRIKITPIGKGNTTPESLDVQIELNVGCTFSLNNTSWNFPASGGESLFTVTTQTGCTPIVTGGQNWLNVISTVPSANGATVNYLVSANYGAQRTGTISVSGQTFTVTQSAATTACAVPPAGMVAWWRGEANSLDETGANNGTASSGVTYSAAKVGGGFKGIGGSAYPKIVVPDSSALALDHSLSIEGWVRLDASGSYAVLNRSDSRDYNGSYSIYSFSDRLFFRIRSAPNGSEASVVSPATLAIGQFYHFAATLDDATGQMKLYINGSLAAQTTTTIRPFRDLDANSSPGLAIGNLNSTLAYDSFNGVIDELSIYNRAINATEVQAIYNAGTASSGSTGKCLPVNRRTPFDFDGDSKTDVGIFRPDTGAWWINRSANNQTFAAQFGSNTDKLVPGDYTGDGKTDVAFYRPSTGQWFILRSENQSFFGFPFGTSEDIPAPADFDGDGKTDPAIYRPSNGAWYILRSSDGGVTIQQFGIAEDKPTPADYDGDGKADIGVYRPSQAQWWILRSSAGLLAAQFGAVGDKAVPGDYTGDGKADIAFWRPSTGYWYILRSEDNSFYGYPFGTNGDVPAPGDYDGDGKMDASVFRPANNGFYSQMSSGGFLSFAYGASGDQPIASAFVR